MATVWKTGIILIGVLEGIAFLGYMLAYGQMAFWGGTVITNLLLMIP